MYNVNFIFKNSPNILSLTYKDSAIAQKKFEEFSQMHEGRACTRDDYGMDVVVDMSDVSALSCGNYTRELEKQGEMQIIQAKATLKTQKMAQNDIGLQVLNGATNKIHQ